MQEIELICWIRVEKPRNLQLWPAKLPFKIKMRTKQLSILNQRCISWTRESCSSTPIYYNEVYMVQNGWNKIEKVGLISKKLFYLKNRPKVPVRRTTPRKVKSLRLKDLNKKLVWIWVKDYLHLQKLAVKKMKKLLSNSIFRVRFHKNPSLKKVKIAKIKKTLKKLLMFKSRHNMEPRVNK